MKSLANINSADKEFGSSIFTMSKYTVPKLIAQRILLGWWQCTPVFDRLAESTHAWFIIHFYIGQFAEINWNLLLQLTTTEARTMYKLYIKGPLLSVNRSWSTTFTSYKSQWVSSANDSGTSDLCSGFKTFEDACAERSVLSWRRSLFRAGHSNW